MCFLPALQKHEQGREYAPPEGGLFTIHRENQKPHPLNPPKPDPLDLRWDQMFRVGLRPWRHHGQVLVIRALSIGATVILFRPQVV